MAMWRRMRRTRFAWALAVVVMGCSGAATAPPPSPLPSAPGSIPLATGPSPASVASAKASPSSAVAPTPAPASAAATIELPGIAVGIVGVGFAYTSPFAVDKDGNLYLPTRARTAWLTKLAPDGTVLATYADTGVVAGQADVIAGVAVDPASGDVWASDATSDRILHLTGDLKPLGGFGKPGLGDGRLSSPGGIALLPDGSIVVAEMGAGRIEVFKQDGTLVRKVDAPGGPIAPYDVAVGANGQVWVTGSQPGGPYPGGPVGAAVELGADGSVVRTLTTSPGGPLWFPDVATSGDTVYIADAWQGLLAAKATNTLAAFTSIPAGGEAPAVVRVSPTGNIYASACAFGRSDCTITEFSPGAARLASWHLSGVPDHPGSTSTVNGRAMYLQCIGRGSPTILWISGAQGPGWQTTAQYLQGRLADVSRVCVYDRQGLGFSESAGYGDMDHWLEDTADLAALLGAAKVKGPFIVAGHSYGGLLARIFAYQHPKDVVGVLAIDPSSENQFSQAVVNPDTPAGDPTCKTCPFYPDIEAVRKMTGGKIAGSLGKLPLIVIGHAASVPFWPGPYDATWLQLGRETATASSNSVHVTGAWSGHIIPLTQPGLVVESVRELVAAARAPRHTLPACGRAMTAVGGTCD